MFFELLFSWCKKRLSRETFGWPWTIQLRLQLHPSPAASPLSLKSYHCKLVQWDSFGWQLQQVRFSAVVRRRRRSWPLAGFVQRPAPRRCVPAGSRAAMLGAAASTPISSTIVLAVPTDYLLDGGGGSKCIAMVQKWASQLPGPLALPLRRPQLKASRPTGTQGGTVRREALAVCADAVLGRQWWAGLPGSGPRAAHAVLHHTQRRALVPQARCRRRPASTPAAKPQTF